MHTIFTESIPILTSNLFITKDAIKEHLLKMNSYAQLPADFVIPSYKERSQATFQSLPAQISLTLNYSDSSLDNTIAYHPIAGIIRYDYGWWHFSTKQFMRDIQEAENNPGIIGHLIVVCSGGGETYCIEKAVETLASCQKPVVVLIEGVMASAALYLCLPANKIYATTAFDTIGSIGTMVAYWDMAAYWKNLGLNFIEAYATESTHKNKTFHDLEAGEKDEYIKTVLDPLQEAFHNAVATYRPATTEAPAEAHVFNGATWYSPEAQRYGLIDGYNKTFQECVTEVYELGLQHKEKISTHQKLYPLINS